MAFELFKYNSRGEPQNNFGGASGKRYVFNNEVESYLDDMQLTKRADGSYFLTCSSMVIKGKGRDASTNVGICKIDAGTGELPTGDEGQFVMPFVLPVRRTVFHVVDSDNEDIYVATELGDKSLYGVVRLTNRRGFLELDSYGGSNLYKSSFAETDISGDVEDIALVEVGSEKKLIVVGETFVRSDTAGSKKVALQRFNTDGRKDPSYGSDSVVIQDHPLDRDIGINSNLFTSNENVLTMTTIKEENGENVILAGTISDSATRMRARAGLLMKFNENGDFLSDRFGPDRQRPGETNPSVEYKGYSYIHAQQIERELPFGASRTVIFGVTAHKKHLFACGLGQLEAIDTGRSGNYRVRGQTVDQALVIKTFAENGNLVGSAEFGGFGKNGIVYIGFQSTIDLVPEVFFNNFNSRHLCHLKGGSKYCIQKSEASSIVVDSEGSVIVGLIVQHAAVKNSSDRKALQEVLLCKLKSNGKIDTNFGDNGTGAIRVKQYLWEPDNIYRNLPAPLVGLELQIDDDDNIYLGVKEAKRGISSENNPTS